MHLVFIWYFNAFLKAKESSFDLSHSKAYPEIGLRNVFFKLRFGTLKRDNLKVLVASGNKSVKLGIASKKWQQCGGGNIFAAHPCFGIIFSGRMLTICRLPKVWSMLCKHWLQGSKCMHKYTRRCPWTQRFVSYVMWDHSGVWLVRSAVLHSSFPTSQVNTQTFHLNSKL